ncbi:glycine cleavage system protein R [sulfur-oxidizing endosymbiont of Gigantopelta aegis]|uniref:glycine cleavage system protein R n=1 Tax=sulfur-oxidizing endosymbiont of Gigantopelta aegis TaxID=2794934 RepID=UPI0018DDD02D|nr:ACT domain-containing protein [sulfur-oxidizing endosymbiont of Gigantopelta aegis]
MSEWKMLTLVGQDKPGIVAKITTALFEAGAQLGEASMMRLGGNFTIMLMVKTEQSIVQLNDDIESVAKAMQLSCYFQDIEASLHQHAIPDTCVTVYGADRAGIVSKVTSHLLDAGFNIMDLDSDVAGDEAEPIYVMHIEGVTANGTDALEQAMEAIKMQGVHIDVTAIDVMIV